MDQKIISSQQLKDFVLYHKLINSDRIIQFNAIVTMITSKNKITNKNIKVMVTFEGYNNYGQLSLFDSEIDPYLFPTVFEAKYQIMQHIDNEYLEINDVHTKNPDIGKYKIKIIPLEQYK